MTAPFDWVTDVLQSHLVQNYPEMAENMAWKNLTFDTKNRKVWIKVINSRITEEPVTIGPTGDNEMRGFIQFSVYSEINSGTELSEPVINRLSQIFKVPQHLQGPEACLLRLNNKMFSQGGQTSLADYTRGGVEGSWDADFITIYWLAREPKERI